MITFRNAKSSTSPFKTIKLLSESAAVLPIISTTFENKVKKDWTILTIAYGTASNVHFLSVVSWIIHLGFYSAEARKEEQLLRILSRGSWLPAVGLQKVE